MGLIRTPTYGKDMGEVKTINETDFIWFEGKPEGITHAILYDAVGADHIPAVVGASLVADKEPIGYMTSKHIHSSPHTFLDVGFTGWPIYRHGHTLIVEVLTPAHISKDISQQKNAWLFNYPPARDIAKMLLELGPQQFFVLTSGAFDDMLGDAHEVPVLISSSEIGEEETMSSLQPLWGWLPAFMYGVESDSEAYVFVIPPHGPRPEPLSYEDSHIRESIGILKQWGFDTKGALTRSKKIYSEASKEASKAAKHANEVIARMKVEEKKGSMGGMFQ
jgi:hypothetical protein